MYDILDDLAGHVGAETGRVIVGREGRSAAADSGICAGGYVDGRPPLNDFLVHDGGTLEDKGQGVQH